MGDKAFVDTNVLLRALSPRLAHHIESEALIYQMWRDGVDLWVNRQVIREYLVRATHPATFSPAYTLEQVLAQLKTIQTLFRVADETAQTTEKLLELVQKYPTLGKQVHDANIVATMLTYGIDTLLTINVADMKRFSDVIQIISPVVSS